MSDVVWFIPLSVGSVVLAYRLIRAPYEIHLEQEVGILALKDQLTESRRAAFEELNERRKAGRLAARPGARQRDRRPLASR